MGEIRNEWTSEPPEDTARPRPVPPRAPSAAAPSAPPARATPGGRSPLRPPPRRDGISTRTIILGALAVVLVVLFVVVIANRDASTTQVTECVWEDADEPPAGIADVEGGNVRVGPDSVDVWRQRVDEQWERCTIDLGGG